MAGWEQIPAARAGSPRHFAASWDSSPRRAECRLPERFRFPGPWTRWGPWLPVLRAAPRSTPCSQASPRPHWIQSGCTGGDSQSRRAIAWKRSNRTWRAASSGHCASCTPRGRRSTRSRWRSSMSCPHSITTAAFRPRKLTRCIVSASTRKGRCSIRACSSVSCADGSRVPPTTSISFAHAPTCSAASRRSSSSSTPLSCRPLRSWRRYCRTCSRMRST